MVNSRDKGARGERAVAGMFRDIGFSDARRGQQFSGLNGDADVVGIPNLHIEVKFREKMQMYDWIEQAKRDARKGELPVVISKKNNCNVLVTMEWEVFYPLFLAYYQQNSDEGLELIDKGDYMACPNCKHEVGTSANYCKNCGTKVRKNGR